MKQKLDYEDELIISKCKEIVSELIQRFPKYKITPREISGLSKALEALSSFPKQVIDGYISITSFIRWDGGGSDYSCIEVSKNNLTLYSGGSVYNEGVGSDSFTNDFYNFSNPTHIDVELQIDNWIDGFNMQLESGELSIEDEAEFIELDEEG